MTRKRLILIIVTVLVLGGAGFFVWQYVLKAPTGSANNTNGSTATDTPTDVEIKGSVTDAQEAIAKKDYTTAYASLDAVIDKTADKPTKANLINEKASVAVAENDLDKALQLSLEAYKVYASNRTAQRVADAYARLGDKTKAIEYYRLALELTGNDTSINYVRYYEAKIADLEAKQ